MACKQEISTYLPILAGCPTDDTWFFVGNASGGIGEYHYGKLLWSQIKSCLASSLRGINIQFTVGSGDSPISIGATTYVLALTNIIEDSIKVELPQDNLPHSKNNQFSYSVAYTSTNVTITFYNYNPAATNIGVEDGMLLMITGTRIASTSTSSGGGTEFLPIIKVYGNEIVSDIYANPLYAGYAMLLTYNGVGDLEEGVDFTRNVSGGFTLIGSYAGITWTSTDKFILTPNGLV